MLGVMKPHKSAVIEFARQLAELEGIIVTNSSMVEIDREIENIKATLQREYIAFQAVENSSKGGAEPFIPSADKGICGECMVMELKTAQD
ncbi:MAG: DUF211 domain-containing protein [Candidatus Acetothermia bacterium]